MSAVRRWATSFAHGANLGAIYTTAWERDPELSHVEYRSVFDPGATHRAGVDLPAPARLAGVRILWTPGYEARAFRVLGRRAAEGAWEALGGEEPRAAAGRLTEIDFAEPLVLFGVAVEQLPGGGSAAAPDGLAIRALALKPAAAAPLAVAIVRADGAIEEPATPFPHPELPGLVLDCARAAGLRVSAEARAGDGVLELRFVRIGAVGTEADLAGLAAALEVADAERDVAFTDGGPAVVAGVTTLLVRVRGARSGPLHVQLPVRPAIVGLAGAAWHAGAAAHADALWRAAHPPRAVAPLAPEVAAAIAEARDARADLLGERLAAAGTWDLAAARALVAAPRHAAALGVPGMDERAGVSPDGYVQLPVFAGTGTGSVSACTHVGIGVEGLAPLGAPARTHAGPPPGPLALAWEYPGFRLEADLVVEAAPAPSLVVRLRAAAHQADARPVPLRIGIARRDWLTPLPCEPDLAALAVAPFAARAAAEPGDELVLAGDLVPNAAPVVLRLPLGAPPAPPEAERATGRGDTERAVEGAIPAPPRALDFRLPDPAWDALARALHAQCALFLRADGTMPYGLWPSVYDGDVYGLEEDWVFHALALWGDPAAAARAFRATYLTAAHLDKRHYLHDLRNGLTPWQALRLARLAGGADFLDDADRAHLRACGEWAARERRHAVAGAVPGLLPPFRYGGDLDFPTQSLFANAANVAGVRALATLLPGEAERWRAEADDYERTLLAAFDAVRTTDAKTGLPHVPLHTGAGDPGDYYQLMVCGILETYEFFAPDDPRLVAMHDFVEQSGRLCLALPRFDGWGAAGFGIDAHYAVGYLLNAVRAGRADRRPVFWTGLLGLAAAAMDPDVHTFREVGPVLLPGAPAPIPAHLPGRHLGLTEPCIGGPGVVLMLLRHALLSEALGPDGQPGRTVRVLPAPLPSWWAGGDFWLRDAPTNGGAVSVHVENHLAGTGEIAVRVEGAGVEAFDLTAPAPPGFRRTEGAARTMLPPGAHRIAYRYERT